MTLPLFSLPLYALSVLFIPPFCSFPFILFFCYLLSSLLYATPILTVAFSLHSDPLFFHLFLFLFSFLNYFLSSLFCLCSFTTSAHWLGVLSLILYFFSFLIGIHYMQDWTATTRYGVTRKRNTKRVKNTINHYRKKLQLIGIC